MEWDSYLDHIRSDSALVATAARKGLDAVVPCCDGWTVRDLVGHLGKVQLHKELIVRERLTERPEATITIPEDGLVDWFEAGAAALVATLAAADPSMPVWSWHDPDRTVGFWYRRMAQEALIHRVDAEQSHGPVSEIDGDLAADGVDELITVMLTGVPEWASFDGTGRAICVSVPGRSWSLEEGRLSGTSPISGRTVDDLIGYEIAAPRADIATSISGDSAAVDLWLWGRGPLDALAVDGVPELAGSLREAAKDVTQ